MTHSTGPVTPSGQQINSIQNQPAKLDMLAAADVKHADSQRREAMRASLALLLSSGSVLATSVHSLAVPMSIVGFIGAIGIYALSFVSSAISSAAAKIQEQFDSTLFGLPPTAGSTPFPSIEEIRALARRYAGKPKIDWYVDVSELPRPYAVLLCQRENLQWDWPLRRSWANRVLVSACAWVGLGLAIALIADWTTREFIVRWLAPSLPSLILATDLVRVNRSIATRKQSLALEVEEALGVLPVVTATDPLPAEDADALTYKCRDFQAEDADALTYKCRDFQAQIFQLRDKAHRVPGYLFRRQKDNSEEDARAAASLLRARLLGIDD